MRPTAMLDGAEVLYWAWSAPDPFFVMGDGGAGGVAVHGLAVCRFAETGAVYRFACDADWEVLNDSPYEDAARARAAESLQFDVDEVDWRSWIGSALHVSSPDTPGPPGSPGAERALVSLLQLAYSGEQAAGLAYRGHWKSVSLPDERLRIRRIEEEEWHHRALVGEMLAALGAEPDRGREVRTRVLGKVLGALCRVTGWLAPMYGAGKLESRNVREYENAARLARDCGRDGWTDCLLAMAEVEWEHEAYFRAKVREHRIGRWLPLWKAPAPKGEIRASFLAESGALPGIQPGAPSGDSSAPGRPPVASS